MITHPTPPLTPLWQPLRHIPQLDGVRGMAILIVTLYRFSKEMPTDSWLGQSLHTLCALGDRGVDLFFVLSGFLITGILLDNRTSPHYFVHFLARRSLRIFPLYFTALFLCLVVAPCVPAFRGLYALADSHQFYLWTYLTNIKMSLDNAWCFGALDHFWSLAVEEHFYFLWPLVVFYLTGARLARLAAVAVIVCGTARIGFAAVSDNGLAPDVLTIFRCDALLIGGLLAMQIRQPGGLAMIARWVGPLFAGCLFLGLAAALLDKRWFTVAHTTWPLVWACVLVWLLTGHEQHWLARLFNARWLRRLGTLSYAMYVFQSPLIPLIGLGFSVPILVQWLGQPILANLLYMACMFLLTYAAALLSWYGLEQHCLKLKKWFPTHNPQALGLVSDHHAPQQAAPHAIHRPETSLGQPV